jgi:hypothetical protein
MTTDLNVIIFTVLGFKDIVAEKFIRDSVSNTTISVKNPLFVELTGDSTAAGVAVSFDPISLMYEANQVLEIPLTSILVMPVSVDAELEKAYVAATAGIRAGSGGSGAPAILHS